MVELSLSMQEVQSPLSPPQKKITLVIVIRVLLKRAVNNF